MNPTDFAGLVVYSLKAFLALFIILTPFVGVSAFVAFSSGVDSPREKGRLAFKTSAAVAIMMVVFFFGGGYLFQFFGVSLPAFQIAGGIVIFGNGLAMVRARTHDKYTPEEASDGLVKEDFSVVPLATPMLCGPATISTVLIYAAEAPDTPHMIALIVAIVLSAALMYLLLRISADVARFLGQTGMNVLTRIMGLLIASVAVQVMIKGAAALDLIKVKPG
jgi:multiple antibiotic resistance protein